MVEDVVRRLVPRAAPLVPAGSGRVLAIALATVASLICIGMIVCVRRVQRMLRTCSCRKTNGETRHHQLNAKYDESDSDESESEDDGYYDDDASNFDDTMPMTKRRMRSSGTAANKSNEKANSMISLDHTDETDEEKPEEKLF